MYGLIEDLRINLKARDWCRLPYPDHPKGCPNYNHKATCPPKVCLVSDYFDLTEPLYLVAVHFDLGTHIQRMLGTHPKWSKRQARCVLYWQAGVNKGLAHEAQELCGFFRNGYGYTTCPEAMGVNVIATAQVCGIPIQTKPTDTVYKVAFVGKLRGGC